jgi:peptide/nickel transport system permease protein
MPTFALISRAAAQQVRGAEYVAAARALGAGSRRILLWHVLPNVRPALIGAATVTLAWSILNSAALNYLGFGGDPGIPEWGAMLAEARQAFRLSPWAALAPGLAITLTLLAVTLAGQTSDTSR